MNRLFTFVVAGAFAATLHAQSSPQSNQNRNTNTNQPQLQTSPQGSGQRQDTPADMTINPSGAQPAATQPTDSGSQRPAPQPNATGQPQTAPADTGAKANPNAEDAEPGRTDPAPVKQPRTEILPEGKPLPAADPIMEPGEVPKGTLTLIGGTAVNVDRLRNRVTLKPFGSSKKTTIRFDERSHIYRDGRETTVSGIQEGDRVYADTQLVGPYIFARSIRVQTISGPAEARGQVTRYNAKTGQVTMTDQLTSQPVTFFISRKTAFRGNASAPASAADIMPGSLIDVLFAPGSGKGGQATEVAVLATPGSNFVFAGRVTNLDLRAGVLSLDNQTDDKNYDLYFDPSRVQGRDQLRVGSDITVRATFDGRSYRASDVTVSPQTEEAAQQ